jgi:hypothetical protein
VEWGVRVVRNGKRALAVLRIYSVCLEMVREVRPYADSIARFDRDQARQLRKSSVSVVLNLAEVAPGEAWEEEA